MSYKATNKQVIDNAFKTFTLRANGRIERGMKGLAEEALSYVTNAHEIYDEADSSSWGHPHRGEKLEMHIQGSNTLAVAVGHNGSLVFSKAYEGGFEDEGKAEEIASDIARKDSAGCWIAVIVSDMQGTIHFPYKHSKELQYLTYSRTMVGNYAIHNFIRK